MIENNRRAIIDIGSNTIRLVVFGGAPRAPVSLYNEKLAVGLGKGVSADGRLTDAAMETALGALARFKALVEAMDVVSFRAVATAAVRDAENGAEFIDRASGLGLNVELLSGEAEAAAAGYGVIAAMPHADGIVADLGGGSLELVRVSRGEVGERVSLPLGVFALPGLRGGKPGRLRREVQRLIAGIPWIWRCNDLPLYLVGGSWRSLARTHIYQSGFPLPVIDSYAIPPNQVRAFSDKLAGISSDELSAIPAMPSGRVAAIPITAALLAAIIDAIAPTKVIFSAYGLREGILFQTLPASERSKDPLVEAVRFSAGRQNQFDRQGQALASWLDRLFVDEDRSLARLRRAVCHMVGAGWASNPEFRAATGEELALHGSWIGVDARERALMGMALYTGLGGRGEAPPPLAQLADQPSLSRARCWGLALRLAQRLSGGAAKILEQAPLELSNGRLLLRLPPDLACLNDSTLNRRHVRLADALSGFRNEPIVAQFV